MHSLFNIHISNHTIQIDMQKRIFILHCTVGAAWQISSCAICYAYEERESVKCIIFLRLSFLHSIFT
jgi:hypothetical protein